MDTVLVTGGAGFIGSHLVKALRKDGLRVRVLDTLSPQIHGAVPRDLDWLHSEGVEFVRGSVTDPRLVESCLDGPRYVVHLAAETGTGQSMYEIERYNAVNSQGTALLLDVMMNRSKAKVSRFVLASSRSVYGEGAYACMICDPQARVFPPARSATALAAHEWEPKCPGCGQALTALATRETDTLQAASIYAATKYAQEELVRIACGTLGVGFALLRFQNVYGEGQSLKNPYTGILSIFSNRVRRDLDLPIFEDGKETRDFVHVEDIARSIHAALTNQTSADCAINVGSGAGTSVLEVAQQLTLALGRKPNLKVTGEYRIGDIRHNFADITRLREKLNLSPSVSLAIGLGRLAQWILAQPLPEDRLAQANAEMRSRGMMG